MIKKNKKSFTFFYCLNKMKRLIISSSSSSTSSSRKNPKKIRLSSEDWLTSQTSQTSLKSEHKEELMNPKLKTFLRGWVQRFKKTNSVAFHSPLHSSFCSQEIQQHFQQLQQDHDIQDHRHNPYFSNTNVFMNIQLPYSIWDIIKLYKFQPDQVQPPDSFSMDKKTKRFVGTPLLYSFSSLKLNTDLRLLRFPISPESSTSSRVYSGSPIQTLFDSIHHVIDLDWFKEMDLFLCRLTTRQRFTVMSYTANSMKHITSFLILGPDKFPYSKFVEWSRESSLGVDSKTPYAGKPFHPLFFPFLDLVFLSFPTGSSSGTTSGSSRKQHPTPQLEPLHNILSVFINLFMKKPIEGKDPAYKPLREMFFSVRKHGKNLLLGSLYQSFQKLFSFDVLSTKTLQHLLYCYAHELNTIILSSPPTKKPFFLYRGTSTNYILQGSTGHTYTTTCFTSCSLSGDHAMENYTGRECCMYRLYVLPGSRVLFLGGNTFYPQELEFVFPMSSVYHIVQKSKPVVFNPLRSPPTSLCPDLRSSKKMEILDLVVYSTPREEERYY